MKQNEQKAVAFGKLLATLGRPEACFRTLYLDDADAAEYLSLLFHGAAALFDGTQDAEIPALRKWYRAAIKCGKGEGALTEADFGDEVTRRRGEYVICFPAPTDSLWTVAKRYHAPIAALTAVNLTVLLLMRREIREETLTFFVDKTPRL